MGKDYYFRKREEPSYVAHSSGPWEDHKYIKKDGDKYIYPGDKTADSNQQKQPASQQPTPTPQAKPAINIAQPKKQENTATGQAAKTDTSKQKTDDKNSDKHVSEMASSVIRGKYGNGEERKKKLRAAGESWERIQNKVNEMLGNKTRHKVPEDSSSKTSSTTSSSESSKSTSKKKKKKSTSSKKKLSGSSKKRKTSTSRKSTGKRSSSKTKTTQSKTNTVQEQIDEEQKLKDQVKHGSGGYYIKRSDRSDYIVHSSGPWKKHKYLKKIGDGANAVYEYATNYANGVKNANRDYQRAKESAANAQAFSRIAREEAPRDIKSSKRREKAAISAYNRTGNHQYLKRASSEQQKQSSISRGVYNSSRVAYNAEQRVSNAKKYRKRAATKPARDLVYLIKSRTKKKKKSSKNTINLGGGVSATFGKPTVSSATRRKSTSKLRKKARNKINLGGGVSATYGKVKLN